MWWLFQVQLFVELLIVLKLSEGVPIETAINFEDDWDYKMPPHATPMLNNSQRHFFKPFYTFVEDLKVLGLREDAVFAPKQLPTSRESKIIGDVIRSTVSCSMCNLGTGLLYAEVKSGTPFEEIKNKFVSICVSLKIESSSVCSGIFDVYGPEVIPVMQMMSIGPSDICKLIFGEVCANAPDVESHEWKVEFPDVEKPVVSTSPLPEVGNPVFKVLQISDTHYDLDYTEGSVANCEEPLCCRTYSTLRENEEMIPAGRWGSYEKCDAPKELLQNMLDHIALQHPDIDYILWTGDLPPHDIWNQTKENNLNVIKETMDMVFNAFPNIPIFPAIGNHESSPSGNFAPSWMKDSSHSPSWLYEKIAESWSKWLPKDTEHTVYHGAFYSVLLRPGLRLISVNTNYCHSLSWWLLLNSTDPASELKWLIHELQQAESKGEKVHIIGHIGPGATDCMKTWSSNFNDIVDRYESTIVALFYGHSHADEFEVFYETTNSSNKSKSLRNRFRWRKNRHFSSSRFTGRPTAVAYLAPSVTTFTNYNPAYRIYYIDGDHENTTREVLEHETWTFDLALANLPENEPHWYKLYSAKEAYQMESLRPGQWDKLIERMVSDKDLFATFYRNYYRNSAVMPSCDSQCKVQIFCDLKSAKSHSRHQFCQEFEAKINK